MEDREQGLWLRGALLLIVAPGLLTILVYAAAPSIEPTISERSRAMASVAIGFGAAMCLTGIWLLGIRGARPGEFGRADRIWLFVHALSTVAMGLGGVAIGSSLFGVDVGPIGPILLAGGFAIRIAARLARRIAAATPPMAGGPDAH
jgi:hypothetical protein